MPKESSSGVISGSIIGNQTKKNIFYSSSNIYVLVPNKDDHMIQGGFTQKLRIRNTIVSAVYRNKL